MSFDSLYYLQELTDSVIFKVFMGTSTIMLVITIISWWMLFEKAGEAGWKAIVPLYNLWIFCKIATAGVNTVIWFFGTTMTFIVPFIGWGVGVFLVKYIRFQFAQRFTNNDILKILNMNFLISPLILAILAFGDYKYSLSGRYNL